MLKLAVVAAFVELLYVIAQNYLPGFPITRELVNAAVLVILGFLGIDIVEFAFRGVVNKLQARGLWK